MKIKFNMIEMKHLFSAQLKLTSGANPNESLKTTIISYLKNNTKLTSEQIDNLLDFDIDDQNFYFTFLGYRWKAYFELSWDNLKVHNLKFFPED